MVCDSGAAHAVWLAKSHACSWGTVRIGCIRSLKHANSTTVRVHLRTQTQTQTQTHARAAPSTHARTHAQIHARTRRYTHARMHGSTHARTHADADTRTRPRTHAASSGACTGMCQSNAPRARCALAASTRPRRRQRQRQSATNMRHTLQRSKRQGAIKAPGIRFSVLHLGWCWRRGGHAAQATARRRARR